MSNETKLTPELIKNRNNFIIPWYVYIRMRNDPDVKGSFLKKTNKRLSLWFPVKEGTPIAKRIVALTRVYRNAEFSKEEVIQEDFWLEIERFTKLKTQVDHEKLFWYCRVVINLLVPLMMMKGTSKEIKHEIFKFILHFSREVSSCINACKKQRSCKLHTKKTTNIFLQAFLFALVYNYFANRDGCEIVMGRYEDKHFPLLKKHVDFDVSMGIELKREIIDPLILYFNGVLKNGLLTFLQGAMRIEGKIVRQKISSFLIGSLNEIISKSLPVNEFGVDLIHRSYVHIRKKYDTLLRVLAKSKKHTDLAAKNIKLKDELRYYGSRRYKIERQMLVWWFIFINAAVLLIVSRVLF